MVKSEPENVPDGNLVKLLVGQERIEGKIDRMSDRVSHNSERLEALLDVVTGSKSGAHKGLVVRTHDLEKTQAAISERVSSLEADEATRSARLDEIGEKLDKVIQFQEDHPPFLYLIRYQTSSTIRWLLVILAIILILWTTGALSQLLSLFGL